MGVTRCEPGPRMIGRQADISHLVNSATTTVFPSRRRNSRGGRCPCSSLLAAISPEEELRRQPLAVFACSVTRITGSPPALHYALLQSRGVVHPRSLSPSRWGNEMSKIQSFATVAALILAGIAGWLTSPSRSDCPDSAARLTSQPAAPTHATGQDVSIRSRRSGC